MVATTTNGLEDHVVAMIAYDEQDLSTAAAVYADIDGNGLVTNACGPFQTRRNYAPSCRGCVISRDVIGRAGS
jgi:hypothetical protein